jgi:hypothetical protein
MTQSEEVNEILNKHIIVKIKDIIDYKSMIKDIIKWKDEKLKVS